MESLDFFFQLGRPLSPLYSFAMSVRALLYEKNIFKTHKLPVPVLSVGNLTLGGTGKTPMVAMLAKQLLDDQFTPAIVSRGYGGTASASVNIVSDGENMLLDVGEAGDEPFMLASTLPGVPVLTGKKRIHPCHYAVNDFGADIIILDDGFQHLSVNRDVNIVLFNATTLAGNSRVFPGGDLREPVKALSRADIFVLTGVDERNERRAKSFQELLTKKFPQTPVCFTKQASPVISSNSGAILSAEETPSPLFAFSGIAHPTRFFSILEDLGLNIVQTHAFKDHVQYGQKEQQKIRKCVSSCNAAGLITTLKDKVKLTQCDFGVQLFHLLIETEAAEPLLKFIYDKLADSKPWPST